MRIPYAPSIASENPSPSDETTAIYERIAARRKPRPLIPLDLALLHAPPIADGWNHLLGAIRTQTVLEPALLELAVCRIAVLNSAVWEWTAHAPIALKAGLPPSTLKVAMEAPFNETEAADGLSEKEKAVLAYTDAMTREIKVSGECFARVQRLFSEREVVELTACVAGYNCVSRFLVALDVGENNGKRMKGVDELVAELGVAGKGEGGRIVSNIPR